MSDLSESATRIGSGIVALINAELDRSGPPGAILLGVVGALGRLFEIMPVPAEAPAELHTLREAARKCETGLLAYFGLDEVPLQ